MWSKGAVVIVKHGDPEMRDEMEKIFKNNMKGNGGNYCFLPRRHTSEELKAMIESAQEQYGKHWVPPKWAKSVMEGFAFIIYHICIFIEKYLKL